MLIEEKWQKYVDGTGRWRKKRFGGEDGQRKVRR